LALEENQKLGVGIPTEDGLWLQVKLGKTEDRKGYVLREDCEEAAEDDPEIPHDSFVIASVIAEWRFNATTWVQPLSVVAEFLIARAIIETGLTNSALPSPTAPAGPLQVSTSEWDEFLREGKERKDGFTPDERLDWVRQIDGAAYSMHRNAMAMADLMRNANFLNEIGYKAEEATEPDRFIPSYLDQLFAHLAGSKAALAIKFAPETDKDVKVDRVLSKVMQPPAVSTLQDARSRFFGAAANPKTLGEVLTFAEKALDEALAQAAQEIATHMPEAVPAPIAAGGETPWLTVARAEEAAGVTAREERFKNRILDYFNATDHGRPPKIVAWCGAFAAHCMRASGNAVAAANIPKGAAGAVNWADWGAPVHWPADSIREGAVVVLSPSHVGFAVRLDGNNIILLGGNQSKKVGETPFRKSQVRAVRWLDVGQGGGAATAKFKLPPGIPADRQEIADMIITAFAAAGYGLVHQLAALANAIGESKLNPMAHNAKGEDSIGLFQLNRKGGVGKGHSVEELQRPERNIALIIAEANRRPQFRNATTLEAAVDAFVRWIERPKDKEGEIARRLKTARKLMVS
jgi:uncharacterized protein (TIGR02594 family)